MFVVVISETSIHFQLALRSIDAEALTKYICTIIFVLLSNLIKFMSQATMVIYLKNPEIKQWLAQKAKQSAGKKSTSSLVAEILTKEYEQQNSKNPLLQYFGAGKNITDSDWKKIEKAQSDLRKNWVSKPDSYYQNLFKD